MNSPHVFVHGFMITMAIIMKEHTHVAGALGIPAAVTPGRSVAQSVLLEIVPWLICNALPTVSLVIAIAATKLNVSNLLSDLATRLRGPLIDPCQEAATMVRLLRRPTTPASRRMITGRRLPTDTAALPWPRANPRLLPPRFLPHRCPSLSGNSTSVLANALMEFQDSVAKALDAFVEALGLDARISPDVRRGIELSLQNVARKFLRRRDSRRSLGRRGSLEGGELGAGERVWWRAERRAGGMVERRAKREGGEGGSRGGWREGGEGGEGRRRAEAKRVGDEGAKRKEKRGG